MSDWLSNQLFYAAYNLQDKRDDSIRLSENDLINSKISWLKALDETGFQEGLVTPSVPKEGVKPTALEVADVERFTLMLELSNLIKLSQENKTSSYKVIENNYDAINKFYAFNNVIKDNSLISENRNSFNFIFSDFKKSIIKVFEDLLSTRSNQRFLNNFPKYFFFAVFDGNVVKVYIRDYFNSENIDHEQIIKLCREIMSNKNFELQDRSLLLKKNGHIICLDFIEMESDYAS